MEWFGKVVGNPGKTRENGPRTLEVEYGLG